VKSSLGLIAVDHFTQQKCSGPLHLHCRAGREPARHQQAYTEVREICELSVLWRRGTFQIGYRYRLIGQKSRVPPILHIVQIDISSRGVIGNFPVVKPPAASLCTEHYVEYIHPNQPRNQAESSLLAVSQAFKSGCSHRPQHGLRLGPGRGPGLMLSGQPQV